MRTSGIHRPGSYYRPCYSRHQILTLKFRLTFIGVYLLSLGKMKSIATMPILHMGVLAYSLSPLTQPACSHLLIPHLSSPRSPTSPHTVGRHQGLALSHWTEPSFSADVSCGNTAGPGSWEFGSPWWVQPSETLGKNPGLDRIYGWVTACRWEGAAAGGGQQEITKLPTESRLTSGNLADFPHEVSAALSLDSGLSGFQYGPSWADATAQTLSFRGTHWTLRRGVAEKNPFCVSSPPWAL